MKIKKKYRFHLLGLVHLPTSEKYMSCAFTQKNVKLARMLMSMGHEVFVYGALGADKKKIPCTEFIETHTVEQIADTWGEGDNRFEVGYDWTNTDFRHDFNSEPTALTLQYYGSCIKEINKRKKPDDFLLVTQGSYQDPIKQSVDLFLNCESGIGYRGSLKSNFRAFESAYIQNFTYGSENPYQSINGSYYDRVIPNYFDGNILRLNEYPHGTPVGDGKFRPYALFIGRMIKRKGILTAVKAAKEAGVHLVIVGQGAAVNKAGQLIPTTDPDFVVEPGDWTYFGYAGAEDREALMQDAVATFTPTEYLECFGGTHVESMLCGTPVLTTSFGVFGGDTFVHGVHGFKCDTLDDFVFALKKAGSLDRSEVRKNGERFLMENVAWQYEKWFQDLYQLYLSALDDKKHKGWHNVRDHTPEFREHGF